MSTTFTELSNQREIMRTIYKYVLSSDTSIDMPVGAELLSVHQQEGKVCLWALIATEAAKESRRFLTYGTGHVIPDKKIHYLGTVYLYNGMVFHVFEDMSDK